MQVHNVLHHDAPLRTAQHRAAAYRAHGEMPVAFTGLQNAVVIGVERTEARAEGP